MQAYYTAPIQHRGEWWISWIREVSGVTCQERTRKENNTSTPTISPSPTALLNPTNPKIL